MKKGLYIGAALLSTCILSGCGSKVLECNRSNDYSEEMKMNQTVKATFKGKEVTNLTMNMNITLSENYLEYRDNLKSSIEDEFSNLKNSDGVSFNTKDTSNGFTFNLDANITKMDEKSKGELNLLNTKQSYEDAKKEFEDEGYTCK